MDFFFWLYFTEWNFDLGTRPARGTRREGDSVRFVVDDRQYFSSLLSFCRDRMNAFADSGFFNLVSGETIDESVGRMF